MLLNCCCFNCCSCTLLLANSIVCNRYERRPRVLDDPPRTMYTAFRCKTTESAHMVNASCDFPTPAGPASSVRVPGNNFHWGCCNSATAVVVVAVVVAVMEVVASAARWRWSKVSAVTGSADKGLLRGGVVVVVVEVDRDLDRCMIVLSLSRIRILFLLFE